MTESSFFNRTKPHVRKLLFLLPLVVCRENEETGELLQQYVDQQSLSSHQ